ncbi:DUF4998 domain-containing protein [Niabella beijingensis]|uniref:DUF4998 domain-containing protein n=1 Tax=Niabella beijingensis TaxID=2872700 RepID=UPI001CBDD9A7|nr:DUF4998 domain-containing protein [Niabella beijingensis]MBZ4187561.1 discoidin domain-containing protein [Niabella beijingensis]
MKKTEFLLLILLVLGTAAGFSGCSKMDATYKEFLDYGQQKYPGKPVNAVVSPGYKRMILSWANSSDPKVTKAKVYWNNRADSLDVQLDPSEDSTYIPFNDMPEATYVFEIYTFDGDGNRSVKTEVIGRVYGDFYKSTLLSRPIYDATVVNDSLWISWGGISDTAIIGTEVTFKDKNDVLQKYFVDKTILLSQFPDFPRGDIQYRTVYVPGPYAIDTFYTEWTTMYVKGQRYALPKAGWTVTASSFDIRSGASYRPPELLIDNDPATIWVNQIGAPNATPPIAQTYYPHWAAIDMKQEYNLEGIIVQQRNSATNLVKDIELYTSTDGLNWTFQLRYSLENRISAEAFIDLPQATTAQYIKIIALNDYGNSNNVALAEFGAYIR